MYWTHDQEVLGSNLTIDAVLSAAKFLVCQIRNLQLNDFYGQLEL